MRFQGKIIQWDAARGFGYIEWNGSSDKLFVHISAFADRRRRPAVGDIVTYEAERDAEGRHHAIKVMYPASAQKAAAERPRAPANRERGKSRSWISAMAIAGVIAFGAQFYSSQEWKSGFSQPVPAAAPPRSSQAGTLHCAGKVHCSEMESCEEARFYLQCPGVRIDGDNDGVPCEDRCGH